MKHTINGWLGMSIPQYAGDEPSPAFFGYKPNSQYYVAVREHSIEVEIADDFDLRPGVAEMLDKKEMELKAEFAKSMTDLQGLRNRLLCLEMA